MSDGLAPRLGEDIVTDCFVPADTEAILRLGSYDAPEWLDSEGHGYVAQDWWVGVEPNPEPSCY
jgi:hypothetical protein